MPYFGPESEKIKFEIVSLLSKCYPFLNPSVVLINPFSLLPECFFSYKDRLPKYIANRLMWFMNFVVPRVGQHTTGQLYVASTIE